MKKWQKPTDASPHAGGNIWVSFLSKRGREVTVGIRGEDSNFYSSFSGALLETVNHWKPYYHPKPPKP